jgi:hypothetical protein
MKKSLIILFLSSILTISNASAQYWPGDNWYNNPLGFEPLKLHTSMSFLVPAAIVGGVLLLTKNDTALQQRLSVHNESSFLWGYKYPNTFMAQNSTGVNYMLRKWMSAGVEVSFCIPADAYNNTVGVGVRPFARFYPVSNKNLKLYFEAGGGLVYFFDQFPRPTVQDNRLGTHLNGLTEYGVGADVALTPVLSLAVAAKHLHVSNGNTSGAERNPSHDSNGLSIGFSLKL